MSFHAALKALHIVALCIWCAGLLVIPTLYRQRTWLREGAPVHELHRFTRSVFVGLVSPAAVVAVGTGTGLVFVGDVFTPWMFLKLMVVGALVVLHMRAGFVIVRLFNHGQTYPRWRQFAATASVAATAAAILVLVLAKPRLGFDMLPDWLRQPGGLQSLSSVIVPMP